MNKDSRMRSFYLSGEWVRICGLLKSTSWLVIDNEDLILMCTLYQDTIYYRCLQK